MTPSNMTAKSSTGNLVSIRGDARISVAEKWANRRKLQKNQNQQQPVLSGDSGEIVRKPQPQLTSPPAFSMPPICVLLRRSINTFIHNEQKKRFDSGQSKVRTSERGSNLHKMTPGLNSSGLLESTKHEYNQRIPFPSVLSVLKANAVQLQVETMRMAEENERYKTNNKGENPDGDDDDDDEMKGNKNKSGLSILPANCNDFTTSAVNHMSESRSRAFLLLDFTAIVQAHTVWRKRLGIQKNVKDVHIVYSVRHNSNARLLQLLQRLGIGLRVATKYDLAALREANLDSDQNYRSTSMIWDDSSVLVKPNSFYRKLVLDGKEDEDEDESMAKVTKRIVPITVGNAEEMERIQKQLRIICERRGQNPSDTPILEFVLKLDNKTDDFEDWKIVLKNMHKKASELSCTEVVGVALELDRKEGETTDTEKRNSTSLLDALSSLIKDWHDEIMMSKIPSTENKATISQLGAKPPQVHLTNPITATEIESPVLEWIQKHRKLCNAITIDTSRLLMANAAALCTRIIGVKCNEEKNPYNDRNEISTNDANNRTAVDDRGDDGSGANVQTESIKQQKKNEKLGQQHLYIDDGCYGSLSNYSNEGIPLPLKSQRYMRSLSETSKQLLEERQKVLVETTVWGPTCDGLDKVCSNVLLPRLSRDDWLVFTDHGFCNEGTCFNGFSPPDIACCVLGGIHK